MAKYTGYRRPTNAGIYRAAAAAAAYGYKALTRRPTANSAAGRRMASRTGTRNQRNRYSRGGTGTSYQRDSKVVYTRKPAPRRIRKSYRKFAKRVNSVIDATAGTTQLVLSNGFSVLSGDDSQNMFAVTLAGVNGTSTNWNGDLNRIMNVRADAQDTGVNVDRKIHMKTMVLDCTFKNDFVTPGVIQGDSPEFRDPVELDIYEFYVKKDAPFTAPEVLLTTEQTADVGASLSYGALTPVEVGATPFNFRNVGSYVTITKKTKHFIAPGNSVTYQLRESRNKWVPTVKIEDFTSAHFGIPGWTKGIFVVFKGTPWRDGNPAIGYTRRSAAARITGSVTRIYNWRNVDRNTASRTSYLPAATG